MTCRAKAGDRWYTVGRDRRVKKGKADKPGDTDSLVEVETTDTADRTDTEAALIGT
jgi:hypothetical protein